MIVDDEPDILITLKKIFEHYEYEVITVKNGLECLKELDNGFQGVILMDLMMPELNGWDTIKEIIERGLIKNVAIEIITAMGTKDPQRMGVLGPYIYDYLTKPLNINELISSVEKCNIYLAARNK